MIRTLSLTAAALAFAGTAFAGTAFTATLETPVESAETVVAAKALWDCEENICTATLDRRTVRVSTCKKVAKEIGKLAEFSNADEALSAEDLERCNSVVRS